MRCCSQWQLDSLVIMWPGNLHCKCYSRPRQAPCAADEAASSKTVFQHPHSFQQLQWLLRPAAKPLVMLLSAPH